MSWRWPWGQQWEGMQNQGWHPGQHQNWHNEPDHWQDTSPAKPWHGQGDCDKKKEADPDDLSSYTYLGGDKGKSLPLPKKAALIRAYTNEGLPSVPLTNLRSLALDAVTKLLVGADPLTHIASLSTSFKGLADELRANFHDRYPTEDERKEALKKIKSLLNQWVSSAL